MCFEVSVLKWLVVEVLFVIFVVYFYRLIIVIVLLGSRDIVFIGNKRDIRDRGKRCFNEIMMFSILKIIDEF